MEFSIEPKTIFDILFGVVTLVAGFIYRLHINQYKKDQAARDKEIQRLDEADAKSERKLEQAQIEGKGEMDRKFNELRQDLYGRLLEEANQRKEVFQALQTNSDQFWGAMNGMKDAVHQFQTTVLKEYHTKAELGNLLDDKLSPLKDMVKHMQTQMTEMAKRRTTDH